MKADAVLLIRAFQDYLVVQTTAFPKTQIFMFRKYAWLSGRLAELSNAVMKRRLRRKLRIGFRNFLASGEKIRIPRGPAPDISIVIVTWNQAELTCQCFLSLERQTDCGIEVIVVDNGSSDRSSELFSRTEGITLMRNEENEGYLHAVNKGASKARGEFLLLLNNDAAIRPGALTAALACMRRGDVGAVGGRIILPNGRLQEAGSIIWRDGTCLGYARGARPDAGEAMFRRAVDFCSGAFLLVRTATFSEMGGFSTDYAPAYYEETDLCMRLTGQGLSILFEPGVVIDHYEFGSSRNRSRAIAMQARNREKFVRNHSSALRSHYPPGPANVLNARSRSTYREKVLFIDDRLPVRGYGAGYPRANSMIHTLFENGCFITHYPLREPRADWQEVRREVAPEIEVALGWGRLGLAAFLAQRAGFYDKIIVSRPHDMEFFSRIVARQPALTGRTPVIYDAEALFFDRLFRRAEVAGDSKAKSLAMAARGRELALAAKADRVIAVSERDAESFRSGGCHDVRVVGLALAVRSDVPDYAERKNLLFVGNLESDHSPNADSIIWFIDNVMPRLRRQGAEPIALTLAGRTLAPSVLARASDDIHILGQVPDLRALYDCHRVFVAPTRFAAGIPHKVHEAAANGLPTVATPLLARQLNWNPDRDLLAAEHAEDFAQAVLRLYHDSDLWARVQANARARVDEESGQETFSRQLIEAIAGL
ncbi:glycosyltransferase [Actibacterium sp. MT2.3-13A]|uniref:glycosyltransferase n=1 Tax=Actibacterium sp. MT2.3-13A TaxID=2828332 RepID=UPI001BAAE795|nr:glycosyltransferase [Actibacterium sp. MT2.3-13A]